VIMRRDLALSTRDPMGENDQRMTSKGRGRGWERKATTSTGIKKKVSPR